MAVTCCGCSGGVLSCSPVGAGVSAGVPRLRQRWGHSCKSLPPRHPSSLLPGSFRPRSRAQEQSYHAGPSPRPTDRVLQWGTGTAPFPVPPCDVRQHQGSETLKGHHVPLSPRDPSNAQLLGDSLNPNYGLPKNAVQVAGRWTPRGLGAWGLTPAPPLTHPSWPQFPHLQPEGLGLAPWFLVWPLWSPRFCTRTGGVPRGGARDQAPAWGPACCSRSSALSCRHLHSGFDSSEEMSLL